MDPAVSPESLRFGPRRHGGVQPKEVSKVRSSRMIGSLALAGILSTLTGLPGLAAAPDRPMAPAVPAPAFVSAIGEGASDVTAFFNGPVKGIVHAAVLGDGSVRVRSMVRGADSSRRYRVIGSSTACGQAPAAPVALSGPRRLMGELITTTHAAGSLPDRTGLLLSVRIIRAGGGQVGCAGALSYEPLPVTAAPSIVLENMLVTSFMSPTRPRGLLVVNGPGGADPQLRWSLTGLKGVSSFRIVASTAPCGTANTAATQTYRSKPLTATYGLLQESEFVDWSVNVRSIRITASGGRQLACTARGREVRPLL